MGRVYVSQWPHVNAFKADRLLRELLRSMSATRFDTVTPEDVDDDDDDDGVGDARSGKVRDAARDTSRRFDKRRLTYRANNSAAHYMRSISAATWVTS